jgi:hypothetical protein
MKKLLLSCSAFVFLLGAGTASVAAQATELNYDHRVPGDRALTIELGPTFPLAFQTFNGTFGSSNLIGINMWGIAVGGNLGLDLDFYLTDTFRLGGGLKGLFALGPNDYTLFIVPITVRATWELKVYPFSFPVGVGGGFSFVNYQSQTSFSPTLAPTAGAYWNMSSTWSFGLDVTEWVIFQPYFAGGSVPPSDSRIGYFTDFSLAAIYHF